MLEIDTQDRDLDEKNRQPIKAAAEVDEISETFQMYLNGVRIFVYCELMVTIVSTFSQLDENWRPYFATKKSNNGQDGRQLGCVRDVLQFLVY